MAAERAATPEIVRDPRICGGEPTIKGTRIPVWIIAAAWRLRPDMADMLRAYPHLTPAAVAAALAYYATHPAEIDAAMADNDVDLG